MVGRTLAGWGWHVESSAGAIPEEGKMAVFAASKHKEEADRLRAENAALSDEVARARKFALLVARLMGSSNREDVALFTIQVINELESAGYIKE